MYFSFPNKVSRYISLLIELSIASLLLLGTYYLNKKFHAYLIKLKYANLHYLELSRWAKNRNCFGQVQDTLESYFD